MRSKTKAKKGQFIVKVQFSTLTSNKSGRTCIIYNKDHSVCWEGVPDKATMRFCFWEPLPEQAQSKCFAKAHIDSKMIVLDELIPVDQWPEW